jgi:hypothetical protein
LNQAEATSDVGSEDDGDSDDDDDDNDDNETYDDDENDIIDSHFNHPVYSTAHHLDSSLRTMTHPWHANLQPVNTNRLFPIVQTTAKKFNLMRWTDPLGSTETQATERIPCPLLIASRADINLLQPEINGSVEPVITLDEPLFQVFDYGTSNTRPTFTHPVANRMSLHAIISELGVLIVGSPNGKVAVYSLFRTDDWLARPRGTYFMRLDWHLPFASQEQEGDRPERKLLGLTVGPMQGQLGPARSETRRRWRLMLYYADHSLLSYELSLPEG